MESREAQISAVTALDESTRCQWYNYVLRTPKVVSRDDAAAALGLPRSTAGFHHDRLVDQGLLDRGCQRLTGRSGPRVGRLTRLYRCSSHQVTVSLPPRHYELAGRLLKGVVDGLAPTKLTAQLHPTPTRCGVRLGALLTDEPHPDANVIMD